MIITDTKSKNLLDSWYKFRLHLEKSETPFEDVARYFLSCPRVRRYTDPYDQTSWPTPWELIVENQYCDFNILLGICYTIQLTERFKSVSPVITLSFDPTSRIVYCLLLIDGKVFGFDFDTWVDEASLPTTLVVQKKFQMPPLN